MAGSESQNDRVVRQVRQDGDAVVVTLGGELDMHRAMDVRECLLDVLGRKPQVLLVNLADVAFMDSTGLATLVEALQVSRRKGVDLRLAGIQTQVRAVFEIARLDSLFQIYADEAEALGA